MKNEFWHERWEKNEIGFHQNEINPYLIRFFPKIQMASGSKIFVPLCGKSQDMIWLQSQGLMVTGVEVSPLAIETFFKENDLRADRTSNGKLVRWSSGNIEILCGDFFDLNPSDLNRVVNIYDRASLIALRPEMRQRYSSHLISLLQDEVNMLLVTLEYPQKEMQGPPFAVKNEEIKMLYGKYFEINNLLEKDVLDESPYFKEKGLTCLIEKVYLLSRK